VNPRDGRKMTKPYIVHGSPGSGSVPIEAALTLIGIPYDAIGDGGLSFS